MDWTKTSKLTQLITRINEIRKDQSALQFTNNIDFCTIENDQVLAYFKQSEDKQNNILCIVNIDPYNKQGGWVQIPKHKIGHFRRYSNANDRPRHR